MAKTFEFWFDFGSPASYLAWTQIAAIEQETGATAQHRCAALVRRYETLFPGVADTTAPHYWAGLRPSTPTNIPYIGRSRLPNLWLNAGHGTLGWTHGAGSGQALAELISGKRPALQHFGFCGDALPAGGPVVPVSARAARPH